MQQHHGHIKHQGAPARRPEGGGGSQLAAKVLLTVVLAAVGALFLYYLGSRLLWDRKPPPEQKKVVEAPIKDEEWKAMVDSLEKLAASCKGHVGLSLKDLETGKTWDYNSDRLFPSASLIKVPIMVAVLEKIRLGSLTLDTQLKLKRRERVGGSGSLKWVREGTSLSVMEIIYKMITESDNTATRMLIDYVGMPYLAEAFKGMGLERTNISEEGMSLASRRVYRENFTTAREMAALMERIYSGELVSREASEFMLDVLKHNKSRSRLRKGLPLGWEIGHKTGLLRRSCHDVGVVFSPRGDYVIAVLTSEVPDYAAAKNFISKVAKLTFQYYKIDSDYASARRGQSAG